MVESIVEVITYLRFLNLLRLGWRDRLVGDLFWWIAISYSVVLGAWLGVEVLGFGMRSSAVIGPFAKSSPVLAELISVCNLAERHIVRIPRRETVNLRLGNGFLGDRDIFGFLSRKHHTAKVGSVGPGQTKSRTLFARKNFENTGNYRVKGGAFPDAGYGRIGQYLSVHNRKLYLSNFYPSTLISGEVMPQVTPLEGRYYSVSNSKGYSDHFKDDLSRIQFWFPPLKGLIPGIFGLWGIAWGWWNIRRRNEDVLPYSPIAFAFGCVLWGYACFILLPWSVS